MFCQAAKEAGTKNIVRRGASLFPPCEATWALTRGFLVAGSRRVIASDWLVDDEATANLISYACGGIANALAKGDDDRYATSLHAAKRWLRSQEKWRAPYYWAAFVQIGPN